MPTDLHSLKLPRSSRTYYFDIAKSTKGFYLRMSCAEKNRIGFEHHRLFVFEEDLSAFLIALERSATEIKRLQTKPKSKHKPPANTNPQSPGQNDPGYSD